MRFIPVRLWGLAILAGVLQILPFPVAGPVPVWRTAFCWFALVPLLMSITGNDARGRAISIRQGALLGYACGFVWYLGSCYWIFATMHLYGGIAKPAAAGILILFCLYLGLYHALFGALVAVFRQGRLGARRLGVQGALLLSPFAWVAVELARARVTSLPWDFLGVTQVDNPLLSQLAPYTGAYGMSFVIAAVNILWLTKIFLKDRRYTRPALTLAGVAIIVAYVVLLRRMPTFAEESISPVTHEYFATATLLQENLEVGAAADPRDAMTKSEMLRSFSEASLFPKSDRECDGIPELASTKCHGTLLEPPLGSARVMFPTGLIVWPESPAPFEESDPEFREVISRLARVARAPVIAGDIGIDADPSVRQGYDLHNSASFITPDGSFAGRYDKMHLVPFGEYVPFKKLFFFAKNLLWDVGTYDPGTQRTVFSTGGHTYGTLICYESVFADEMRQYAEEGADVLVNISNDGWYGDTSAAWQHLNMVRMRALENHRWILRATNTGVTAVIDPYGRVVKAAPRHIRTALRVGFNYEHDVTFYSAHGDVFAYLCALVTVGGLGVAVLGRRSGAAT